MCSKENERVHKKAQEDHEVKGPFPHHLGTPSELTSL